LTFWRGYGSILVRQCPARSGAFLNEAIRFSSRLSRNTVARADGEPVAFAGIWEEWRSPEGEQLQTFSTITTDANQLLSSIQDRMPVIIERENWPLWLGEVGGDQATLLRPATEDVLRFWPVDKKVGNVRNDGPELIEPIIPAEAPLL
jgi:putative SOS response-associated peptidase YedK